MINVTAKADLSKAHLLIADQDVMIARVLRKTLNAMGLKNLTFVKSGREAIEVLTRQKVDILITEWEMEPLDGIQLLKTMRQSEETRIALLPAIMLTARAEKDDVLEARDGGVTEFLVKPFTAKTLYNRLEHVIDFPRDFVVAEHYVGPDRRRLKRGGIADERRILPPAIVAEPRKINHVNHDDRPYKIIPSQALKKQLGILTSLSAVITPEVLEEAQAQISSFTEESMHWITEDMARLELALEEALGGNRPEAFATAKDALLSIKSRAGTFGYLLASDLAFSFYGFLRGKYTPQNPQHPTIARKHLEVLKILLAHRVIGSGTEMERELVRGLKLLTEKF